MKRDYKNKALAPGQTKAEPQPEPVLGGFGQVLPEHPVEQEQTEEKDGEDE
jgi:hypothetical protein